MCHLCCWVSLFLFRVTRRRISSLQLKVTFVPPLEKNQLYCSTINEQAMLWLRVCLKSVASLSLRAKGGNSKWLLADDLGAEHSHYCHGDQSEGEEGGRRARADDHACVSISLNLKVIRGHMHAHTIHCTQAAETVKAWITLKAENLS